MVAGEDQHLDMVEARLTPPLPASEPGGEILEPAEASLRLGEARLPLRDRRSRGVVATGKAAQARSADRRDWQ